MAEPAKQLNAHRSALLLKLQRGREHLRRIDVARAEQVRASAASAERRARERRQESAEQQMTLLQNMYDTIQGQLVDCHALERIVMVEREGKAEAAEHQHAVIDAQERLCDAEQRHSTAVGMLQTEAKATSKREKLADDMQLVWLVAAEAAVEAERDEQVLDGWSAR